MIIANGDRGDEVKATPKTHIHFDTGDSLMVLKCVSSGIKKLLLRSKGLREGRHLLLISNKVCPTLFLAYEWPFGNGRVQADVFRVPHSIYSILVYVRTNVKIKKFFFKKKQSTRYAYHNGMPSLCRYQNINHCLVETNYLKVYGRTVCMYVHTYIYTYIHFPS